MKYGARRTIFSMLGPLKKCFSSNTSSLFGYSLQLLVITRRFLTQKLHWKGQCIKRQTFYSAICTPFMNSCHGDKTEPRHHYAGGIWKRHFHSENESNIFRSHYTREIWKRNSHRSFWICVWGKLRQGSHVIIVTSSFSKSFVFKIFSLYKKTQSRRFQIPPVWRAFSKSSVFPWHISVDGRPTVEIKLCFKISSPQCGRCLCHRLW